ncbi:MAG: hypothetical protein IKY52_08365 [Clostridia bacterium]|nr:hypothetical protein [Clostridia bacterium]
MKREKMIQYMDLLDEKYIAEADPANAKKIRSKKIRSTVLRIGSIAACLLFVAGIFNLYIWLFMPGPSTEQVIRLEHLRIGDKFAEYTILKTSRWQEWILGEKIGDQVSAGSIYQMKDTGTLQYLIKDCGNGEYELLQFRSFFVDLAEIDDQYLASEIMREQYAAGILTDEDLAQLRYHSTYTYGEVLESIYGVVSAEDIDCIIWEKTKYDHTEVGKSVPVKKYVMKDEASIKRFYDILYSLPRVPADTELPERIYSDDEAYLTGMKPLCAQTERFVLIELTNGAEIQFYYSPTGSCLYESSYVVYETINAADNEWLIETVDINLSWVDYGVNPVKTNPPGAETAVARELIQEE